MNAAQLLAHFDRLAEAPDAVPRLRRFILDLAVRGNLVGTEPSKDSAVSLLASIAAAKSYLAKIGVIRKVTDLPPLPDEERAFPMPTGWVWERLGALGYTQTGTTPPTNMSECFGGKTPFVTPSDLTASLTTYDGKGLTEVGVKYSRLIAKNSVLMVCIGSTIGKVNTIDRDVCCNQQINAVTPVVEGMTSYIAIALRSHFFQQLVVANAGMGTLPILSKGKWELLPIPVPPLAEQHRIVAKVDELMALCDQLEAAQQERERRRDRLAAASLQRLNQRADANPATDQTEPAEARQQAQREQQKHHARFHLQNLNRLTTRPVHIKAMRQTVLNFAVHGWLLPQAIGDANAATSLKLARDDRQATWESEQVRKASDSGKSLAKNWQSKYVAPVHEGGSFDLPATWVWASALEICECVENGNTPSPHEMTDGNGDVPFLKVYNLTKTGELDFTVKPTFISRQIHEQKLQRSRIFPQDVLMNIVGPPLGKVSLVTDQYPEWNTNQAVVLFRAGKALLPRYLTICLLSDAVLNWITRQAQATVGQSNISVSKSRALPIPLPPLDEQHRIVAKVDELMALCDQLEAQLTQSQTDSRRLLEAVLEAALTPA